MNDQSALTPVRFRPGTLRRGFDELCLELNKEEAYLPPEELAGSYRLRLQEMVEQRKLIWQLLGSPNRTNFKKTWGKRWQQHRQPELARLYIEIGQKIKEIQAAITKINSVTRGRYSPSYTQLFMGVAREMLDESTYAKIRNQTLLLEQSNFSGTHEEWVEFVKTLD